MKNNITIIIFLLVGCFNTFGQYIILPKKGNAIETSKCYRNDNAVEYFLKGDYISIDADKIDLIFKDGEKIDINSLPLKQTAETKTSEKSSDLNDNKGNSSSESKTSQAPIKIETSSNRTSEPEIGRNSYSFNGINFNNKGWKITQIQTSNNTEVSGSKFQYYYFWSVLSTFNIKASNSDKIDNINSFVENKRDELERNLKLNKLNIKSKSGINNKIINNTYAKSFEITSKKWMGKAYQRYYAFEEKGHLVEIILTSSSKKLDSKFETILNTFTFNP